MNENQAREEICRIGKSLFDRGYAHATAGNISVRLDDGYLITPTDACLGFLDPAELALLDANGNHLSGARPSKTIILHRRIYDAARTGQSQTRCIIHTHSHACVQLSLQADADAAGPATGLSRELLAPITPYFVMKVGHVPLIAYCRPGDAQAGERVAQAILAYQQAGTPLRAVMLERLGPNVWHDTPAAAMATLEELEETARLALDCARLNMPVAPLPESALQDLRDVFGAAW
ncbi:MAG: aldolase [Pusillimonas sp.]